MFRHIYGAIIRTKSKKKYAIGYGANPEGSHWLGPGPKRVSDFSDYCRKMSAAAQKVGPLSLTTSPQIAQTLPATDVSPQTPTSSCLSTSATHVSPPSPTSAGTSKSAMIAPHTPSSSGPSTSGLGKTVKPHDISPVPTVKAKVTNRGQSNPFNWATASLRGRQPSPGYYGSSQTGAYQSSGATPTILKEPTSDTGGYKGRRSVPVLRSHTNYPEEDRRSKGRPRDRWLKGVGSKEECGAERRWKEEAGERLMVLFTIPFRKGEEGKVPCRMISDVTGKLTQSILDDCVTQWHFDPNVKLVLHSNGRNVINTFSSSSGLRDSAVESSAPPQRRRVLPRECLLTWLLSE
uniref:Uncharacterized protein n=1 Tax=Timema monikensis TaxID=170555 RepID=A0A7R9E1P1_9NEOP|nr:unnamed protein product [Timema monikensis]